MADDDDSRSLEAKLANSSTAATRVFSKTLGEMQGSINLGADLHLTKNFLINTNVSMAATSEGSEIPSVVALIGPSKKHPSSIEP